MLRLKAILLEKYIDSLVIINVVNLEPDAFHNLRHPILSIKDVNKDQSDNKIMDHRWHPWYWHLNERVDGQEREVFKLIPDKLHQNSNKDIDRCAICECYSAAFNILSD
jgi:hypothetical protein